jgi:hypothetical protein
MTSMKKIEANRENGRKSRGPRTDSGKMRASRNAFRHGLSTINRQTPKFFPQIEQMAKAICGDNADRLLFEQAMVVAEYEFVLRCIRFEKVTIIERLRNPLESSPLRRDHRTAMARLWSKQWFRAAEEYTWRLAKLNKEGWRVFGEFPVPEQVPEEPMLKYQPLKDRDEYQAMKEALPELLRIHRYERRAHSAQNRALHKLITLKLTT